MVVVLVVCVGDADEDAGDGAVAVGWDRVTAWLGSGSMAVVVAVLAVEVVAALNWSVRTCLRRGAGICSSTFTCAHTGMKWMWP